MKKYILSIILTLLITPMIVMGATTIWEYYQEKGKVMPACQSQERIKLADSCGIFDYDCSSEKNNELLKCLANRSELFGVVIPKVVALFEDSLQNSITASSTSMTLVDGTDKEGNSLSGTYGFIIDEGSSDEEFVIATCSGTICASLTRGVSVTDGETSVYSLIKAHRRGASVKVTDAPVLMVIQRLLNGDERFPNLVGYVSDDLSIASTSDFASKRYVDNVANQGAATSTENNAGIVELATQIEMASSTPFDANSPHVINSEYATSSPYSGMTGLYVPVTENDGKLNQSFIDLTEGFNWTGAHNFSGGVVITNASTTINGSASTTGNFTFNGDLCDGTYCQSDIFPRMFYATSSGYFIGNQINQVASTTIPANFLTLNDVIEWSFAGQQHTDGGGYNIFTIYLDDSIVAQYKLGSREDGQINAKGTILLGETGSFKANTFATWNDDAEGLMFSSTTRAILAESETIANDFYLTHTSDALDADETFTFDFFTVDIKRY